MLPRSPVADVGQVVFIENRFLKKLAAPGQRFRGRSDNIRRGIVSRPSPVGLPFRFYRFADFAFASRAVQQPPPSHFHSGFYSFSACFFIFLFFISNNISPESDGRNGHAMRRARYIRVHATARKAFICRRRHYRSGFIFLFRFTRPTGEGNKKQQQQQQLYNDTAHYVIRVRADREG